MILTPQQALERLQPSGKRRAKGQDPLKIKAVYGIADDSICVVGNSQGDIITPLDDGLPSILATYDHTEDTIPPSLQDWLMEYSTEVEWWQRVGAELATKQPSTARVQKAPRQSITPMLETKWGQSSPYNDTIVFEGKKCVTGCNTTAVAQLMYLWWQRGYSRGCPPTEAYKTATNSYDVGALSPITVFDYKKMSKGKPKTAEEKKAVQDLMVHLGRLFKSDYKPNSTTAAPKSVAACLKDGLRMGSFVTYIYASKLGEASFENYVYNELLQNRPVILCGWTTNGGGHSFVVDSYDATNDLYHINWGWGGSYDGWYKMSALNPTNSVAYNTTKTAIIGIHPEYKLGDVNGDGDVNITDAMQVIQDAQAGKYPPQDDINNNGKVTVADAQLIIDKILGRIDL